jgi:hypothetical protein
MVVAEGIAKKELQASDMIGAEVFDKALKIW